MSFLHAMKTGKGKYEGNMQTVVKTKTPKKTKQRNHFTQGKTGYKPCRISDPVDIKRAKRG